MLSRWLCLPTKIEPSFLEVVPVQAEERDGRRRDGAHHVHRPLEEPPHFHLVVILDTPTRDTFRYIGVCSLVIYMGPGLTVFWCYYQVFCKLREHIKVSDVTRCCSFTHEAITLP